MEKKSHRGKRRDGTEGAESQGARGEPKRKKRSESIGRSGRNESGTGTKNGFAPKRRFCDINGDAHETQEEDDFSSHPRQTPQP